MIWVALILLYLVGMIGTGRAVSSAGEDEATVWFVSIFWPIVWVVVLVALLLKTFRWLVTGK